MMRRITAVVIVLISFYFGYLACEYHVFPIKRFIQHRSGEQQFSMQTDFGRLQAFPGKKSINCPAATEKTAVMLIIGQSNSANHAGQRFISEFGDHIINYFDGKCYVATSPLLGATGDRGESFTLMANKLMQQHAFDRVVLIPAGVTDTQISRWQTGGDLNTMMQNTILQAKRHYQISHVIWHQGERDFKQKTSADQYRQMFNSLAVDVRRLAPQAKIFISLASRCGDAQDWTAGNAVVTAQQRLVDPAHNIFLVADTDSLIEQKDRYDGCHFGYSGQEKFASALTSAIMAHP